jgi:hypothetical protein
MATKKSPLTTTSTAIRAMDIQARSLRISQLLQHVVAGQKKKTTVCITGKRQENRGNGYVENLKRVHLWPFVVLQTMIY